MHNTYLPLHIWDREFDSRLVIAFLEACKGNTSIIGHEYNISNCYPIDNKSLLFRAGGPLSHTIRAKWHRNIASKGGIVITQDEEGINNMPFEFELINQTRHASLDINRCRAYQNMADVQAFKDVTVQLAWSNLHRANLCHQITNIESRSVAINKIWSTSSARFDILGDFGKLLNSRLTSSIHSIFENYILILDNFSVDIKGQQGMIDNTKDLKDAGWSKDDIEKHQELTLNNRNIEIAARTEFLHLLEDIATNNPSINFIFRPHPVLDSAFWSEKLYRFQNISIVKKGGIHGWIYGATATIHSGCTTGLEAFGAGIPTIDVSGLLPPRVEPIRTSLMGQTERENINLRDIQKMLRELWNQKISKISGNGNMSDLNLKIQDHHSSDMNERALDVINRNSYDVGTRIRDQINIANAVDVFGSNSAILAIMNLSKCLPEQETKTIGRDIITKYIGKIMPNSSKSRFVSTNEVKTRITDISSTFRKLGLEMPEVLVTKIGINSFMVYQAN